MQFSVFTLLSNNEDFLQGTRGIKEIPHYTSHPHCSLHIHSSPFTILHIHNIDQLIHLGRGNIERHCSEFAEHPDILTRRVIIAQKQVYGLK